MLQTPPGHLEMDAEKLPSSPCPGSSHCRDPLQWACTPLPPHSDPGSAEAILLPARTRCQGRLLLDGLPCWVTCSDGEKGPPYTALTMALEMFPLRPCRCVMGPPGVCWTLQVCVRLSSCAWAVPGFMGPRMCDEASSREQQAGYFVPSPRPHHMACGPLKPSGLLPAL